jgi:hypothetical protein
MCCEAVLPRPRRRARAGGSLEETQTVQDRAIEGGVAKGLSRRGTHGLSPPGDALRLQTAVAPCGAQGARDPACPGVHRICRVLLQGAAQVACFGIGCGAARIARCIRRRDSSGRAVRLRGAAGGGTWSTAARRAAAGQAIAEKQSPNLPEFWRPARIDLRELCEYLSLLIKWIDAIHKFNSL